MGNPAFQWTVSDSATPPAGSTDKSAASAQTAPATPSWVVTGSKQNLFTNPNREGLYPMQDGQGNTVQVPYSNVITAAQQGYHVDEDTRARYAKDSTEARRKHNVAVMQTPAFRNINWSDPASVKRGTAAIQKQQPLPETAPSTTPKTPSLWADARTAVTNATEPTDVTRGETPTFSPFDPATGEMSLNAIKQTGRVLFGTVDFPVQAWGAVKQSLSDDPAISAQGEHDLVHLMPQVQVLDTVKQLRDQWKQDPKLAVSTASGDALGFWLLGKASNKAVNTYHGLQDFVAKAQHGVVQEASGINAQTARDLVDKTNLETADSIKQAAKANADAADKFYDDARKAFQDRTEKEDVAELNTKLEQAKVAKDHADAIVKATQEHADASAKASDDNARVRLRHQKATGKIEAANAADQAKLTERSQAEQELADETQKYNDLENTTKIAAKAKMQEAWKPYDAKTANQTIDGGEIAKPLKKITEVSPEVARVLRQLTPAPEDAAPESLYAQDRAAIMKSQGYKGSYWDQSPSARVKIDQIAASNGFNPEPEDFDPQAGEQVPVRAVQRARSIIGQGIASGKYEGILLGEMKTTYGVLDSALRRAAVKVGALNDLEDANQASREYLQAYGRVHKTPVTADLVRRSWANPDAQKELETNLNIGKTDVHDPAVAEQGRKARALYDKLKKMPSEDKLHAAIDKRRTPEPPSINDYRSMYRLKPPPELKLPQPPPAVEPELPKGTAFPEIPKYVVPTIKTAQDVMDELIEKNRSEFSKSLKSMRSRAIWWTAVLPWLYIWKELMDGNPGKASVMAIKTAVTTVGVVVTLSKITEDLERPEIREYYAHPSDAQIAELERLSPESKRFVAEGFKNVIKAADEKGFAVSPRIRSFVAANAAATASHYQHTAVNDQGHRIGTNDGGKTWYDVATGKQTHAGQQAIQ